MGPPSAGLFLLLNIFFLEAVHLFLRRDESVDVQKRNEFREQFKSQKLVVELYVFVADAEENMVYDDAHLLSQHTVGDMNYCALQSVHSTLDSRDDDFGHDDRNRDKKHDHLDTVCHGAAQEIQINVAPFTKRRIQSRGKYEIDHAADYTNILRHPKSRGVTFHAQKLVEYARCYDESSSCQNWRYGYNEFGQMKAVEHPKVVEGLERRGEAVQYEVEEHSPDDGLLQVLHDSVVSQLHELVERYFAALTVVEFF